MELYNEQQRFISFTSDYGFKVTFGNEQDTRFLRKALQALIGSNSTILEVTFDKSTFDGVVKDARSGIFDLICRDEAGNTFIVEMQLNEFKHFLQRMKFYAGQKFNTLVRKGDFDYGNLTKIYCVAFLAKNISKFEHYHNIGSIKNQNGELMDDQTVYITVELDKFNISENDCKSDLEKLIFTMKAIDKEYSLGEEIKFPQFWTEEWLKIAIRELDTRAMSPEKRMAYEMILSNNAQAIRITNEQIAEGKVEGAILASKIIKLHSKGISEPEIADNLKVELKFVLDTIAAFEA
jgi:predicted transposase/invertase (TIGR01784 family)